MGPLNPLQKVRKNYRITEYEKHPCYNLIPHFNILNKEKNKKM